MADYAPVAAQVKALAGAQTVDMIAGATIAAGDIVYEDTADSNKAKLADANSATADARKCKGIALNGASAEQPVKVATAGNVQLTTGAAVGAVGATVVLSATAGKMAPSADIAAGMYTNVLGFLDSTGKNINLSIIRSDVAAA